MYNPFMTKQVQNKLLHHLHLLQTLGYTYSKPFDFNLCATNNFELPNNLEQLQWLVDHCSLCEFSKYKTRIDFSQGNIDAKIMFIDETASVISDDNNKIVLGKSGELLITMIEKVLNVPHHEFYYTNIMKCKTALKKEPTPCEINSCKPYLNQQIKLVNPKLIVALGERCYQNLTNDKSSIEQIRGKILKYNGIDIMLIYHPNYLLRNPSSKKEAFVDMLKIKSLLEQM
ncbi:MAG: uracil-DNA glycosylase [Arcobacteraceae bacterium]